MYVRLFLMFWCLSWSTAHAAGIWGFEPAGAQRVVDCGILATLCPGQYTAGSMFDVYNNLPPLNIDDAAVTVSPPKVMRYTLNNSTANGGGEWLWYDSQATTELYVGLSFRIAPTYDCSSVGKSKLIFERTFNARFGGNQTNGVLLFGGCGDVKTFEWSHNTGGAAPMNNQHIPECATADGIGNLCRSNVGPGQFNRNAVSVKLEHCIKASTTSTSRDGVVTWQVDGQQAGRYLNVNYGGPVVNEIDINPTWDGAIPGNGSGFSRLTWQQFDHIVISRVPPGGCASVVTGIAPNPDSPAGPPAAPTGVNATKVS